MILDKFPKKRAELPAEYKEIYELHYRRNRGGETKVTFFSIRLEQWLHKIVSADLGKIPGDCETLEIGAGNLNHLPFEKKIISYDIIEPFSALYTTSPLLKRVRCIYKTIDEIPQEKKYDRIISIATFEHLLDLPKITAKAAMLLKKNGSLRISIPNEGTILWKLGTLITGCEFKWLYGLDYQVLMRYEHVNTAQEIEEVLKYFFEKVESNFFGISKSLAFYRFFKCSEPRMDIVQNFINGKL